MSAQQLGLRVGLALILGAGGARVALAAAPVIEFDFGRMAECRDVTEGKDVYPDEKIIELTLRVSVHLLEGDIHDVRELRFEVADGDHRLRVHSFEPGTRLESNLSEDIDWSRTVESTKSLGASIGAKAQGPLGDVVAQIAPLLSADKLKREIVNERQQRVAPQQAVVVAGTIRQGHGVFFTIRPSPRSSLEGVHELTLRFVVPANWRGDAIRVCCRATGQEKFLWMKQQATWARTCAPVVIYLAGDVVGRQIAKRRVTRSSGT